MGSVRAIPVLRGVASRAARDAIERIKAKSGDLGDRIGLVEDEDRSGALSQTEAGRLSLDED